MAQITKEYLQQRFQGKQSFLENIIFPIFGQDKYYDTADIDVLADIPELQKLADSTGLKSVTKYGEIALLASNIAIYEIGVADKVQMERNRVGISHLVRSNSMLETYSGAFMIFHYENDDAWDWRFSFCRKTDKEITEARRFTFILGPNQSCRTAADNFNALRDKERIMIEDVVAAFDVEKLSDEFFKGYKEHYEKFVQHVTGTRFVKVGNKWEERDVETPERDVEMYEAFGRDNKAIRDFVKRLLGRIVFLHFLQKKGWMGVPQGQPWGKGDFKFMRNLFEKATPEQQDNFLDQILEPLFSEALDRDRAACGDIYDTRVAAMPNGRVCKVPYLNGGLFIRDKWDKITSRFPREYFKDLLAFLSHYNFTIDENDPADAQVGVDPEMLGRIFENLLEDNKDKGAYYTPKEIVGYMCSETLISYLQKDHPDHKEVIAHFVHTHDLEKLPPALREDIDQALREVKICDPAIGSGAFPMGLLKELFLCRGALESFDEPAEIKKHIIQNNIYGVDIERGAVDIARLRFWLSLVVDEKTPHALPNLDFKIMQGNSLLEEYKKVDLSELLQVTSEIHEEVFQLTIYDGEADLVRREISEKLNQFFQCHKQSERKKLRSEIASLIKECLVAQNIEVDFGDLDLSANEDFFLWHTWFADVFKNGGFDIVIGNPPYIQLQNSGGALAAHYAHCDYQTFARTGDIYCLFYERGMQLLRPEGHLCYITSNKWMRAAYGERTRAFFAQNNPKLLIDFAGTKVFDTATVDTNILLLQKAPNAAHTLCAVAHKKDGIRNMSLFVRQNSSISKFTDGAPWVILLPIEQSIKEKIEVVGTPLREWDIKIYRGVLTGCNEAFIINTERRNEILANCTSDDERQRTAELIRPILRGRDIKRYAYEWKDLWLINTHNGVRGGIPRIRIEDYPAIKAHLDQFWPQIESRADQGDTPYNLRNCAYMEDFQQPHIAWIELTDTPKFTLVENMFSLNTVFLMTGVHLEHIIAQLNSTLLTWYFSNCLASSSGVGTTRWLKFTIEQLPIAPYDGGALGEMVSHNMIREIDQHVCSLFGLSGQESEFILSREN